MSWIGDELGKRFPHSSRAREHYGELLSAYDVSGLAPPNFQQEVTSSGDRGFCAHVWEAMLYRHFCELGFEFLPGNVRKAGQRGPDFGLLTRGRTIWVEAIVPAPEGIPPEYLKFTTRSEPIVAKTVPHQEILLRWTAALKAKRDKLQQYREAGIIAATDATVVAINGCRLSVWTFEDLGISRMPYAVEVTFAAGPIAVPIALDGGDAGEAYRVPRYSVQNAKGASVPTCCFLDPQYENVGAVLGTMRNDLLHPLNPTVVHNPLTEVRLPRGIFGAPAEREYVAEIRGEDYLLRPLSDPAA